MQKTFEELKTYLENQYQHSCIDPDSGIDPELLKTQIFEYYRTHRDEPLITVRAKSLARLMRETRIGVDPLDRFADQMNGGIFYELREEIKKDAYSVFSQEFWRGVSEYWETGTFMSWLDISHTAPDWASILRLGAPGLLARAEGARKEAKTEKERVFCDAAICVLEAFLELLRRFAAQAEKVNAPDVAEVFHALTERPPQTFREALQLAIVYDRCQEIEGEPLRSQGHFDRLFWPFYRRDLEQGVLTREEAKELLKFMWTKIYAQMNPSGKNFCFGGLAAPGVDACNDLTKLCFEVHFELNRINPKLSFRVHKNTPDAMLRQVTDSVRSGRTAVVFSNDDLAFEMLRRRGKAEEDIYNYTLIGCYEPAILGREMCCSMSAWGSMVKPFEAVFNNGCAFTGERLGPECALPANYAEFEAEYFRQLDHELVTAMERTKVFERFWDKVNPSPLLSSTMPDCMASRRDVSDAGTRYNTSGVMLAGLGTVVDSLAAVRMLVDEHKLCTVAELAQILRNDWKDAEHLRLLALKRAPKWGNGDPRADELGTKLMTFVCSRINHTPNARGGTFQTGEWSIDNNFTFGHKTGATPDGRHAGDPFSRNTGASIGMEKHGVTALLNSAVKFDQAECPDGAVLDVMLHPSAVSGSDGADVIAGLVRSYFAAGGLMIQFNILNAEDLRKAQEEPEKYDDVQVRVCGWNNKFVNLSHEEQNAFIAQAEAQQ